MGARPSAAGCIAIICCLCSLDCRRASEAQTGAQTEEQAGRARVQRQSKVTEVAPAPIPARLPLEGKEGVDSDGYPLKWIGRAAFRSLLRAQRFAELTQYFEQLQAEFEADPKKEYWINDAAASFASGEPELLPLLDAWVNASPKSFAPYLARGGYRVHVGYLRRGSKLARETQGSDFAAMEHAHKQAFADLEQALSLRPRAVTAHALEIRLFSGEADLNAIRRVASKAAEACSSCLLFRVAVIHALEPRWGGSYQAMAELAGQAPVAQNRRLRVLPAYIELDRSLISEANDKLDDALAATERACALGEYWKSLTARAEVLESKKELDRAKLDIERADQLRPNEPEVLLPLARIAFAQKRWAAAGQALIAGLRINPTNSEGRRLLPAVVQGLVFDGWQQYKAGHKGDALGSIELAIGLDPGNRDALNRKAFILSGATVASSDEIEKLKTAAAPNDLRAHQAVDYALAKQGRFVEVVDMWTQYIKDNPRDGMAHLERGGALFHLGRRQEAGADAQAACDLGVSEGCARAKMIH